MSHQEALAAFRQWDVVQPLTQAPQLTSETLRGSAHCARVITAQCENMTQRFILRTPRSSAAPLGFSPQHQFACLQAAAAHGLAPRPVWQSPTGDSMVMEYVESDAHPVAKDLIRLMRGVHSLTPLGAPLDINERISHNHSVALGNGVSEEQLIAPGLSEVKRLSHALEQDRQVMCHNDLHPDNVRKCALNVLALDWEYAAPGSAYFDVAAALAGWPQLNEEHFVAAVLGDEYSHDCWQLAKSAYAAVSWNWHWAAGLTPGTSEQLAAMRHSMAIAS